MTEPQTTPPAGTGGYRAVTDGDLRDAMDLKDFLVGLGVVMRLPGKRSTPVDEAVQPSRKKRGSPLVAFVTAVICVVALAIVLRAVLPDRNDPLPPVLVGTWQTQAPKYADRGFEIRGDALHMKRGEQTTDVAVLPIKTVRVTPRGSSTGVEIQYQEDGVLQTLDLTLHDYAGATVVELRNQPDVIWRRRGLQSGAQAPAGLLLPPGALRAPGTR